MNSFEDKRKDIINITRFWDGYKSTELQDLDQNHIPRKEERGQVEKDPTVDRQCLDEEGMLGAEKIQRRELASVFLV